MKWLGCKNFGWQLFHTAGGSVNASRLLYSVLLCVCVELKDQEKGVNDTMDATKLYKEIDKLREKNKALTEKITSLGATQTTMKLLLSQVSSLSKNCQACKRRCNQQGLLVDESDSSV